MIARLIAKFSIRLALIYVARGQYLNSEWLRINVVRKGL
jgi:hypothetical protein